MDEVPTLMDKKAFDWSIPKLWICPRCWWRKLSKEAVVRCERCGFRDDGS